MLSVTPPSDTEEGLRQELWALLAGANAATLRRVRGKVAKANGRQKIKRVSHCRPQDVPLQSWRPKRTGDALGALKLMQEGFGVRSAPFPVSGSCSWQHKFFSSDVALKLRKQNACSLGEDGERAATAVFSLLVSALCARVVETAMAIKLSDPQRHIDAHLVMQKSKQDSGWDKTKTRGSGIVFNDAGKQLFEEAVERVGSDIAASVAHDASPYM